MDAHTIVFRRGHLLTGFFPHLSDCLIATDTVLTTVKYINKLKSSTYSRWYKRYNDENTLCTYDIVVLIVTIITVAKYTYINILLWTDCYKIRWIYSILHTPVAPIQYKHVAPLSCNKRPLKRQDVGKSLYPSIEDSYAVRTKGWFNIKLSSYQYRISIVDIRHSYDHLISTILYWKDGIFILSQPQIVT